MPYADREKQLEYLREHYKANKQYYIESAKRSKYITLKLVRDIKESKPCMDCDRKYPYYIMEFDHVSGNKIDMIASMKKTRGRKAIIEEIAKCNLVCSNCHKTREHNRKQIGLGRVVGMADTPDLKPGSSE